MPHLTHRREIYTFPKPWIASNWGVSGENRPDPDGVNWIIVNPSALSDTDLGVLVSALNDPGRRLESGQQQPGVPATDIGNHVDPTKWAVVTNDPNLFVAHRVRA